MLICILINKSLSSYICMVSTSAHWQVSIPLVYTQLVEIVIHIYFLCTLFGMQVQITMRLFNDQSNDNENVHANDNEGVNCSSFPVSSANMVHQGTQWNLQGGIVWYFNNIFVSLTFSTHGRYTLVWCFACTTNIKLLIKLRHHNMMTSFSWSFHR